MDDDENSIITPRNVYIVVATLTLLGYIAFYYYRNKQLPNISLLAVNCCCMSLCIGIIGYVSYMYTSYAGWLLASMLVCSMCSTFYGYAQYATSQQS